MFERARRWSAPLLLSMLLLSSCGATSRPSVAEWEPTWSGVVEEVPALSSLGQPPDRSLCSDALARLRLSRGGLFPTPDPAIEDVVEEWMRVAEHAMFECPTANDEFPDMESAYAELARLQAEVEVVLVMDSPGE